MILNSKKLFFFLLGVLGIFIYYLPFILNGGNAYYRIHDYLEQDYVNLFLNAKYLFKPFETEIPEILGGSFRGSMQVHSFFQILLYKIIQGPAFLNINLIFNAFIGFLGMFLLINKVYEKKYAGNGLFYYISASVSFLYSIIPVLMHGLTMLILPLTVYVLMVIRENKNEKVKYAAYAFSLFLGLSTSLIYGGFVFILLMLICAVLELIKKNKGAAFEYLINAAIASIGYFISFFYMFISLAEISHRSDWILKSERPFFGALWTLLSKGYKEVYSYPAAAAFILIISIIFSIIKRDFKNYKNEIIFPLCLIFAAALFSACYSSLDAVINIRNSMGGILKSVQLDRISLFLAPLWAYIAAIALLKIHSYISECGKKPAAVLFTIFITAVFFFRYEEIRHDDIYRGLNIKYLRHKDTSSSFGCNEFFEKELMNEVKNYINAPQSSYKIISIGINPGVTLYNGFYTLDGYFTNYRLSYKKDFEKVIKKELDKNEEFSQYYGTWGSRVYAISSELPSFRPLDGYKADYGIIIRNLEYDFNKLKEMGCRYIFSRYEIESSSLNFEKKFTSKLTGLSLFVYSIKD